MGLFGKVVKTATNAGKSALNTASNVGSTVGVAAQDQSELASLKMQVNVIEQELDSSFVQIGRRYVDYAVTSGEMPGIDVSDILKLISKEERDAKIKELSE